MGRDIRAGQGGLPTGLDLGQSGKTAELMSLSVSLTNLVSTLHAVDPGSSPDVYRSQNISRTSHVLLFRRMWFELGMLAHTRCPVATCMNEHVWMPGEETGRGVEQRGLERL